LDIVQKSTIFGLSKGLGVSVKYLVVDIVRGALRREMVAQSGNSFCAEHAVVNLMVEGVDAEGDLLLCFLVVGVT